MSAATVLDMEECRGGPVEQLDRAARYIERYRLGGESAIRMINEALESIPEDEPAKKRAALPCVDETAWCHRCGYPKAGHGTWATCGGWL